MASLINELAGAIGELGLDLNEMRMAFKVFKEDLKNE